MPATYAHYYFGDDCLSLMPEKLRNACLKYRDIYNFGVHGPDIFFYYHALKSNAVTKFGSALHHVPARGFFENCKNVYLEFPEKEAITSYICGFLTHFTFDSTVHGYVNALSKNGPVTHNKIEAEYEAALIRKQGKRPGSENRSKSLMPSKEIARIISYFFEFDEQIVYESIKGQKTVVSTFYSPLSIKKNFLRFIIKTFKLKGGFEDLFVDDNEMDACHESNLIIDEFRLEALEKFPVLLKNFWAFVEGKENLDSYFDKNFE